MKNKSILFLAIILAGFNLVSAFEVPSLNLEKTGSMFILPKYSVRGEAKFETNSMVGNLDIFGTDSKKNEHHLQLTIINTNVKETSRYITVEGNSFGIYFNESYMTSINFVPAKYVIYKPSNTVSVYIGKKLIVSGLKMPKSTQTGMITHGGTAVTYV